MSNAIRIAIILILVSFALSACATKGINSTLFLREDSSDLVNLKGESCSESGYQVMKHPKIEGKWILITFYSNCDARKERVMQDFEVKQWVEPQRKPGGQNEKN